MTAREPQPLFIRLTYPMLMGTLFFAPLFVIGYGGWWAATAVVVGIGRWLT